MKIAYISPQFCPLSETFIRDLALGLSEKCDLTIFTFRRIRLESNADHLNITVIKRSFFNRLECLLARILNRFMKRSNEFAAKRIHAIDSKLFERALLSHKPDLIYAEYGHTGFRLIETAKKLDVPLVVHFHGIDATARLSSPFYVAQVKELFEYEKCRIVTPSAHLARRLNLSSGGGRDVAIIPYQPKSAPKNDGNLSKSGNRLCAVGRMVDKKAPLALIEAFALMSQKVPDAVLDYVGEGPLFQEAKERAERLGIADKINFHGPLPHHETLKVMARANVFVQHSVTASNGDQEGLPVAILEALKMHIPVVSTLHSGIPEIVFEGENGFLVREHDYVTMAAKMEEAVCRPYKEWSFKISDERLSGDRSEKIFSIFQSLCKSEPHW